MYAKKETSALLEKQVCCFFVQLLFFFYDDGMNMYVDYYYKCALHLCKCWCPGIDTVGFEIGIWNIQDFYYAYMPNAYLSSFAVVIVVKLGIRKQVGKGNVMWLLLFYLFYPTRLVFLWMEWSRQILLPYWSSHSLTELFSFSPSFSSTSASIRS